MRKFLLGLILPGLLPALFAQPDFKQLAAELGKTTRPHPYLMFTAEEKPDILKRIQGDQHSAEVMAHLVLEGRRLLYATAEKEAPPREMHTRFVGADDYRAFVNRHVQAAFTLAFLYQMTGETRYADKAFEHANVVCAQDTWMQTPHMFDVIYSRVWPYGAKDDEVAFTYDITASSVSQQMAYIYDWLYPALAKPQRDRIRGALLEKAIMRVRGNYEYLWWATAYKCNWSGICHTGLGMAALALLDDDPQLTDVVARSSEGIWNMLEHIGDEGGWQEGRGYWAYGLGESVRFIDAVKRVSGGRINLYQHRSLATHPEDFGLYGMSGGFGDGTGGPVGESYVMNRLSQESGDARAAWYVKNFVRPQDSIFDLIWPATTVKPEKPAEASRFFKSIDWAFLRKDFGADYLTVATKAGMNDDPHHGHLDCGTFSLNWQNQNFVGEVPRTPYDEKYFGAMRWDYLEARTSGHNVVMVNGEEQVCAKLKDEPWKTGIGGHITQYQSEPEWAYVAMDPTHAYPGKDLKQWNRWIILEKETNVVIVLDRVGCEIGANIEVRFHPGVEADVTADHVMLRPAAGQAEGRTRGGNGGQGARAATARPTPPEMQHRYTEDAGDGGDAAPRANRRAGMEMIPLFNGDYTLIHGRQPDLPITEEPQLTWVPYFSTSIKAPAKENVIASIFFPADANSRDGSGPQFKLGSENGSPVITGTLQGKAVKYVFTGDKVTRSTP